MNKGFAPRRKWSEVEIQRLVMAWNSGAAMNDLAARYNVSASAICRTLSAARIAGHKVIERKNQRSRS